VLEQFQVGHLMQTFPVRFAIEFIRDHGRIIARLCEKRGDPGPDSSLGTLSARHEPS
jgi:hypothetical protein